MRWWMSLGSRGRKAKGARPFIGPGLLTVFVVFLWMAVAGLAIAAVAYPWNALTKHPVAMDVPLRAMPPPAVVAKVSESRWEPCEVREVFDSTYTGAFSSRPRGLARCYVLDDWRLRLSTRLGFAVELLVLAGALTLIGRMLQRIRSGNAFDGGNARTLRTLVLLTAVGIPTTSLLDGYGSRFIAAHAGLSDYYGTVLSWADLGAWLGAVVLILALAEAFRQGERMRQEVDGLV